MRRGCAAATLAAQQLLGIWGSVLLSQRILLVDDDDALAVLLEATFESDERFELVGRASNGREAVTLYRVLRPDAVLMDLHMPVLGGIAATREILAADGDACVIAFTASRDAGEHAAVRRAGATGVLSKPFDPEAFLTAFNEHAANCRASKDAA
jgi:CheY-like chemotaxis protein